MPETGHNRRPTGRLPGGPPERGVWWSAHRSEVLGATGVALVIGFLWLLIMPWERAFEIADVGEVARQTVRARNPLLVAVDNPDYDRAVAAAKMSARPVYAWDQDAHINFAAEHGELLLRLRRDAAQRETDTSAVRNRAEERLVPLRQSLQGLPPDDPTREELRERIRAVEAERDRDLNELSVQHDGRRQASVADAVELYGLRQDAVSRLFDALAAAGHPTAVDVVIEDAVTPALKRPIVRSIDAFNQDLRDGVLVRGSAGLQRWQLGTPGSEHSAPWRRVIDLEAARHMALSRAEQVLARNPNLQGKRVKDELLRSEILSVVGAAVRVTLALDLEATNAVVSEQRAGVPVHVSRAFRPGDVIVERGRVVTPLEQAALTLERSKRTKQASFWPRIGLLVLMVIAAGCLISVQRVLGRRERRPRPVVLLWTGTLILSVLIPRLWLLVVEGAADRVIDVAPDVVLMSIPLAWAPMTVAMFTRPGRALGLTIVQLCLLGMMLFTTLSQGVLTSGVDILVLIVSLFGCTAGLLAVRQVRARSHLFRAAVIVAAVQLGAAFAGALAREDATLLDAASFGLAAGLSGILSYLLLTAVVPLFEYALRLPTDLKLLELGDMNNPLLRRLSLMSPGTYNHSLRVAELGERAAESIGAHGLLCRVGAYYHDIGKTRNAGYFAENQEPGRNPHDDLQPTMSVLVVRAHVKEGIEMGRAAGLPEDIIDFIPEHHGTALLTYFYERARRRAEEAGEEIDMEDYRHTGPRPQKRETAIVMLADGVEAATRSLANPSAPRLREVVRKIIREKFLDGQLDECDLTLRDLHAIEDSFVKALRGMYHHRPVYPKSPIERAAERGESRTPWGDGQSWPTQPPEGRRKTSERVTLMSVPLPKTVEVSLGAPADAATAPEGETAPVDPAAVSGEGGSEG